MMLNITVNEAANLAPSTLNFRYWLFKETNERQMLNAPCAGVHVVLERFGDWSSFALCLILGERWRGGYISDVAKVPWGCEYKYITLAPTLTTSRKPNSGGYRELGRRGRVSCRILP